MARALLLGCVLAAFAACFSPSPPDCAYTCLSNGESCPRGLECAGGWCRPADAIGACASADAGSADASADAASSEGDASAASCDDLYGDASGYVLCAEYGGTCEFYSTTGPGVTCADLCSTVGQDCLESYDSDAPDCVEVSADEGCTAIHAQQICVCGKP